MILLFSVLPEVVQSASRAQEEGWVSFLRGLESEVPTKPVLN